MRKVKRSVVGIIDHFGPGGAQRQFAELMAGLAKRGVDVEVVTYYKDDHFAHLLDGVKVHLVEKKYKLQLSPAIKMMSLLRKKEGTVGLAFLSTPSVYAEVAALFTPGARIVVSERSSLESQSRIRRSLRLQLHRIANHVVTNSIAEKLALSRIAPWLSWKTSCVYNGYDVSMFDDLSCHREEEHLIVLALGKVNRNKNPISLAQALAMLPESIRSRFEVWWAGEIYDSEVAAQVDRIVGSAATLSWRWLGLQKDIRPLLGRASFLYQGSFSEGLSNSLCEALCAGVPVVASNISDHHQIISESGAGLVFCAHRAEELADILKALSEIDDAQYAEMSVSAREFARKRLSRDRMIEEYEAILFPEEGRASEGEL
jgi:glycosyltransferase involved in cell wall biosynthesis